MSIFDSSPLLVKAKVSILTVVDFTRGEKVWLKSKLYYWWWPFATIRALYLLIVPSKFSFNLKIHLQPIDFLWGGRDVSVQVWLVTRESYSRYIPLHQSGQVRAYFTKVGSSCERNTFGLKWPILALVSIGWALSCWMECVIEFWIKGDKDSMDGVWSKTTSVTLIVRVTSGYDIEVLAWLVFSRLLRFYWNNIDIGCDI